MPDILLEAEHFEKLGGWILDSQSLEQIGSAYIMAHGMGVPVADAETCCEIPESGSWAVWARTRDWTEPWRKSGAPAGRFKVAINGESLPETLGTNGEAWGWQKAGTVELSKGRAKIALRDLTGFNGRCDALLLTKDLEKTPENDKVKLSKLRKELQGIKTKDAESEYDLIVVGGGIAGISLAFAAARGGAKVALLHDRAVLGGCNSSETRVGLGGYAHAAPYWNLGNVVAAIGPAMGGPSTYKAEFYEDARKANVFLLESRCALRLNSRVIGVEMDSSEPKRIRAVVAKDLRDGSETRFKARLFADCSGDALVARKAGAATMYGREGKADFNESLAPEKADRLVMGMSVQWRSEKAPSPAPFPVVDWGIKFDEGTASHSHCGDWEWEAGQRRDQAEESERIRDYGLMAALSNWSFLKNESKGKDEFACDRLDWISAIGGKRESYRVAGDLVLTQNDIEKHVEYPDATGSLTWNIDLHFPDPINEEQFGEPFRSCAYHRGIERPYQVPYRCLYARDVENLFLGGRILSMTHVAFSCARVQRTLGILGEVAGMAASLCAKEKRSPRDIFPGRFEQLKAMMERGVDIPTYHAYPSDSMEAYHFKELGYFTFSPEKPLDPALTERIKPLGVSHRSDELEQEPLDYRPLP